DGLLRIRHRQRGRIRVADVTGPRRTLPRCAPIPLSRRVGCPAGGCALNRPDRIGNVARPEPWRGNAFMTVAASEPKPAPAHALDAGKLIVHQHSDLLYWWV